MGMQKVNMTTQFRMAAAALFASAAMLASQLAIAAPISVNGIETIRTGSTLITLTAAGPSTVNSADQGGYGKNLTCVLNLTAHTGTESVTWVLQGKQPGTTNYYTVVAPSAALATEGTSVLSVGANFTAVANVAAQQAMPSTWRVQVVMGTGTTPTTTGTVNCTAGE